MIEATATYARETGNSAELCPEYRYKLSLPDLGFPISSSLYSILRSAEQVALMLWHFRTLNTLIKHFGFRAALSVYLTRQTTREIAEIRKIRIPGVEGAIFLRLKSTDWEILIQVFMDKEYHIESTAHAEALNRHYQSIINDGGTPVIIDCGANSGLASIWYSELFPRAIIIAVEPEPENYAVLCQNAENRPSIRPINAAISDRQGRITLHDPGYGSWAWQTVEHASGEIEAQTIPTLISSVPHGKPLIVKIDIEGSEVSLFRSNTDWVDRTPLIVFESHDLVANWHGTAHSILSVLTRERRDYFLEGENVSAFSHSLLGPPAVQDAAFSQ